MKVPESIHELATYEVAPLVGSGWVAPTRLFKSSPVAVSYDVGTGQWTLLEDFTYHEETYSITIRKGFLFDLASIPRAFWWVIAPNELSLLAPLIHDALYMSEGVLDEQDVTPYRTFSRKESDVLFFQIMEEEGVARWRRMVAYSAVRSFGGIYWRE